MDRILTLKSNPMVQFFFLQCKEKSDNLCAIKLGKFCFLPTDYYDDYFTNDVYTGYK